jgi:hypothetical protein
MISANPHGPNRFPNPAGWLFCKKSDDPRTERAFGRLYFVGFCPMCAMVGRKLMTALAPTGRCPPRLIEAARCGDEKALLSLIAAARPDVRRYAARNCGVADIDDAVQRRSEACLGGAILRGWPAAIGLDVSKGIFAEFL